MAVVLGFVLVGCNVSVSPQSASDIPAPTAGTQEQQEEALRAALGYVGRIDRGRYEATWADAGPVLRSISHKDEWTNTLALIRRAFDVPPGRQVEGFSFAGRLDANTPESEYAIVQFAGRDGRMRVTEKVVMEREQGRWMLAGYFITKRIEFKTGG